MVWASIHLMSGLMTFKINVADLLGRDAPSRDVLIEAPVDWGMELSKIRPDPPLEADVTLSSLPGAILARGRLRFRVEHICRRCLTPYVEDASLNVTGLFEDPADEDSYPIHENEIDLEVFLRDEAMLAMPLLPECPDGCDVSAPHDTGGLGDSPAGEPPGGEEQGEWRLEDLPEAEELRRLLYGAGGIDDSPDDGRSSG